MHLYVLGDSHTVALGQGYRPEMAAEAGLAKITIAKLFSSPKTEKQFFTVDADGIGFLDEADAALQDATGATRLSRAPDAAFAFMVGFTTTKLIRRDTWRTHAPWRLSHVPTDHYLSDAALDQIVRDYNRHVIDFYAAVAALGLKAAAIIAPPPRPDDLAISEVGIAPDIVLAVDAAARRCVAGELQKLSIPMIAPPDEVYDGAPGASFLKLKYGKPQGRDLHHANKDYGRLMIGHVIAQSAALFAR